MLAVRDVLGPDQTAPLKKASHAGPMDRQTSRTTPSVCLRVRIVSTANHREGVPACSARARNIARAPIRDASVAWMAAACAAEWPALPVGPSARHGEPLPCARYALEGVLTTVVERGVEPPSTVGRPGGLIVHADARSRAAPKTRNRTAAADASYVLKTPTDRAMVVIPARPRITSSTTSTSSPIGSFARTTRAAFSRRIVLASVRGAKPPTPRLTIMMATGRTSRCGSTATTSRWVLPTTRWRRAYRRLAQQEATPDDPGASSDALTVASGSQHAITFSAIGTHASYATAGAHDSPGSIVIGGQSVGAVDMTAGGSDLNYIRHTENNVMPFSTQPWFGYDGSWGNKSGTGGADTWGPNAAHYPDKKSAPDDWYTRVVRNGNISQSCSG